MIGYFSQKQNKDYILSVPFNMQIIGNSDFIALKCRPSELENMMLSMIAKKEARKKFIGAGKILPLNISEEHLKQFRSYCLQGDNYPDANVHAWSIALEVFQLAMNDYEYYWGITGGGLLNNERPYTEKDYEDDWWKRGEEWSGGFEIN